MPRDERTEWQVAEPGTLSDRVAHRLRELIVRGQLPAGKPLRQQELAARLGVSRIPLREALRQMEGEGFVTFSPYRGAEVRALSGSEVFEYAEMHAALEAVALRHAIPRMTAATIERAREHLEALRAERDPYEAARKAQAFGYSLIDGIDRPRLLETIANLRTVSLRYSVWGYSDAQFRRASFEGFARQIDLCRRGDVEGAVRTIQAGYAERAKLLVRLLPGTDDVAGARPLRRAGRTTARTPGAKPGARKPTRKAVPAKRVRTR